MRFANTTKFHRKSGERSPGMCSSADLPGDADANNLGAFFVASNICNEIVRKGTAASSWGNTAPLAFLGY
jgi:hypothetical protein